MSRRPKMARKSCCNFPIPPAAFSPMQRELSPPPYKTPDCRRYRRDAKSAFTRTSCKAESAVCRKLKYHRRLFGKRRSRQIRRPPSISPSPSPPKVPRRNFGRRYLRPFAAGNVGHSRQTARRRKWRNRPHRRTRFAGNVCRILNRRRSTRRLARPDGNPRPDATFDGNFVGKFGLSDFGYAARHRRHSTNDRTKNAGHRRDCHHNSARSRPRRCPARVGDVQ